MAPTTHSPSLDELLTHASWVRRLALRLVDDADAADELVQRTWLAALERPPSQSSSARRWLAAVMRNFARQDRRANERRTAREIVAARKEALPGADDVVERAALERRVAGLVLDLPEPYRTTILLRFFDELAPREIAKRMNAPVDTVRTRVQRGLEQLRAKLDREHGDRRAWLALVAPLARVEAASSTVLLATLMNAKVAFLLVAASIGGIVALWFGLRPSADGAPTVAAQGAVASAPQAAPPMQASIPSAAETEPARKRESAPTQAPAAADAAKPVAAVAAGVQRGLVLDCDGKPIAGVAVAAEGEARAVSSADGAFELPLGAGRAVVEDESWTTVLAGAFQSSQAGHDVVIVLAPRIELSGWVVDSAGVAIEGARLALELPEDFRSRFDRVLDHSSMLKWDARSAVDGGFAFDRLAAIEGATLTVEADGFSPHEVAAPTASRTAELVALERRDARPGALVGRVLDAQGAPVEDASVAYGIDVTKSDEDGGFSFVADDPSSANAMFGVQPTSISAIKQGHLPGRIDARIVEGKAVWPASLVLRLGGAPLAIAGRVIGVDGSPAVGVRVWVQEAEVFGGDRRGAMITENILAGDDRAFWRFVATDERGDFEIAGLLDREYTLRAQSETNLMWTETEPVAAGSRGVELRFARDSVYPKVAGRLVSRSGEPVAGASVQMMCDAFRARFKGKVLGTSHMAAGEVVTDDQGRFEMLEVPRSLVYLRIDGEHVLPLEYGRWVEGDPRFVDSIRELPADRIEDLEIVVDVRCHVQLELADEESADELALLDERGRELELSIFDATGRREGRRLPITAGRTASISVSDAAKTVVLFKQDVEVARMPVELKTGELNALKY